MGGLALKMFSKSKKFKSKSAFAIDVVEGLNNLSPIFSE